MEVQLLSDVVVLDVRRADVCSTSRRVYEVLLENFGPLKTARSWYGFPLFGPSGPGNADTASVYIDENEGWRLLFKVTA